MKRAEHKWEHPEKGTGNCGKCGKPCGEPRPGAVVYHGKCTFPVPVEPYEGRHENFFNQPTE